MFESLLQSGQIVGYVFVVLLLLTIILSVNLKLENSDDTEENVGSENSSSSVTSCVKSNIVPPQFTSLPTIQSHLDENWKLARQSLTSPSVIDVEKYREGLLSRTRLYDLKLEDRAPHPIIAGDVLICQ